MIITISACAREARAWPQSHDCRVGGHAPHVNDSVTTGDNVRMVTLRPSQWQRLCRPIALHAPAIRARCPTPTSLTWSGTQRTSTTRGTRPFTIGAVGIIKLAAPED